MRLVKMVSDASSYLQINTPVTELTEVNGCFFWFFFCCCAVPGKAFASASRSHGHVRHSRKRIHHSTMHHLVLSELLGPAWPNIKQCPWLENPLTITPRTGVIHGVQPSALLRGIWPAVQQSTFYSCTDAFYRPEPRHGRPQACEIHHRVWDDLVSGRGALPATTTPYRPSRAPSSDAHFRSLRWVHAGATLLACSRTRSPCPTIAGPSLAHETNMLASAIPGPWRWLMSPTLPMSRHPDLRPITTPHWLLVRLRLLQGSQRGLVPSTMVLFQIALRGLVPGTCLAP